jgi:hypothetical protein
MSDYQKDFYSWTREQAELLRSGRFDELDIVNLIEEIETMGRSEKRELENRLTVLLVYLLKWQYQPTRRDRSRQLAIQEQRLEFFDALNDNAGLNHQLQTLLTCSYQKTKIRTSKETGLDTDAFPSTCSWEFVQLMDDTFLPD